ncbi:MAG: hypothetical protein SOR89_01575 [Ndongobacter sp.]|nr:hypothetical protein [Ndongobacter sp.]
MKEASEYFLRFADQLSYLELQEKAPLLKGIDLRGLPLPIWTQEMLSDIQAHEFDQEISLQRVLRGMVFTIAIDPDFLYVEKYRETLRAFLPDACGFALHMGVQALQRAEQQKAKQAMLLKEALIAFRGAYFLDQTHPLAGVQYARLLWQAEDVSNRDAFVQESIRVLEQALNHDEHNALAYASLGEIYEQLGQFGKANSYYRHALEEASEPVAEEEMRRAMGRIAPSVGLEEAIYFIRRADYRRAIETLMEVKVQARRYDVEYYLGVCYENIAQYPAAVSAFQTALGYGADFAELYNDLVFSLNAMGVAEEALRVSDKGIEKHPADLRLHYNRAILLAEQGQPEKALEDCNFILEYSDLSDEMFNQVMILKQALRLP